MLDWKNRWVNFGMEEVLSPAGLWCWRNKGVCMVRAEAMDSLQGFREFLGVPLLVNYGGMRFRGYRDFEENEEVGGSRYSMHVQGVAFDVTVRGMDSKSLYMGALDYGWRGVGLYRNFVHVDLRELVGGVMTWKGGY